MLCRIVALGMAACVLSIATVRQAAAQDKPADATPPPDPDKVTLNFFRITEIGGLVDAYWLYNSNKVPPSYQAFDTLYNSFDISMAELWVADGRLANRLQGPHDVRQRGRHHGIRVGPVPEGIPLQEHRGSLRQLSRACRQGLQIDVGKFVTNAGAEVIEAKDDFNYSRSLLFQLAIPLYHSGVRLTYSPNDKFTLMGGVINGWNDVNDNNTAKSVMAS